MSDIKCWVDEAQELTAEEYKEMQEAAKEWNIEEREKI